MILIILHIFKVHAQMRRGFEQRPGFELLLKRGTKYVTNKIYVNV